MNELSKSKEMTLDADVKDKETTENNKSKSAMSRPMAIFMIVLFIMCFVVHFVVNGIRGDAASVEKEETAIVSETEQQKP